MKINESLMEDLLAKATVAERKRVNMDLRNSAEDNSQRMLNALMPGTKVAIHKHPKSSETVILLKGRMDEILYDDNGKETERIELNTGNGSYGCQIPTGVWHTVEVHEPSVIIEFKDGMYGFDGSVMM